MSDTAAVPTDTERLDALEADMDGIRWPRHPGHPDGVLVELDWFVGDGSGHVQTHGATIREAIDAYLRGEYPDVD